MKDGVRKEWVSYWGYCFCWLHLTQLQKNHAVVFAQIGNSVTLPRTQWGTKDKIHVNWYFTNDLLITRNPTSSSPKIEKWQGRLSLTSDWSLIISPVLESDFGIFRCEQHELVSSTTNRYKLYRVTMPTPPPLLAQSVSLDLSCEIEREGFERVHPTVRWLGPHKELHSGTFSGNKHTLSVKGVSSSHSGKWTCEVTCKTCSTLNAMTDVIIVDLNPSPPDPIYTYDTSSNFPIPCSFPSSITWSTLNATGVTGGNWSFTSLNSPASSTPLLELHLNSSPVWKAPSGTVSLFKETALKNQVLDVKIPKVSINDRGTYTCSVKFKSRTLTRKVVVEVLDVIASPEKDIYEGNTVNLSCTLGHPMASDLEVNWIPPQGSSLPNLSPPHPVELSIPGVKVKHSGRWTCQLKKNTTVLTSATISLKIERAPVLWLVLSIVGGILGIIVLAVIPVIIIRRRRQVMRYRRRKKKYCCCKNPQPKGFYKN
ncbi:hypothetical protein PHYPO_G00008570 [Pangasianodon hypophthalmus]|uniref:Ig-like domain-containing protein n=1 Tax=Pangasianodon hypophthalmus TaxID=310915 RepID=A0A5N5Q4W5_PANHP|nr:hypothetical protein PHYPO_G00008570 [Pangasianodon hypophthalmus]